MNMMNNQISKQLGHDDQSGFEFSKELLAGDCTAAINFDRLQKHPMHGYIIFEYLLCEETQSVTPYTSHPNRYWHKNAAKFLSLWKAALDLNANLFLVNYAKKGTRAEDEVLLIQVLDMDESGITGERLYKYTREEFAKWFRKLNRDCLSEKSELIKYIYMHKNIDELGQITLKGGKYEGKTIASVYAYDAGYLEWFKEQPYPYAKAAWCFLEKMKKE